MGSCFSGESHDEEREPLRSAEQQKLPVRCVYDAEPMKPMVHYEDETFPMYHHPPGSCFSGESHDEEREPLLSAEQQKLPVRCVYDAEPMKPMVHYEDETFPMYHHPPVEAEGENLKSEF